MTKEKIEIEKEKQRQYELKCKAEKTRIKCQKHHFFKLLWYYIKKPFVWLFANIKDWRTAVIFGIVCILVYSEVWVCLLLGLLSWNTERGKWIFGVGTTFAIWWLSPAGSPFLLICISLTILIKTLFNKIRYNIVSK